LANNIGKILDNLYDLKNFCTYSYVLCRLIYRFERVLWCAGLGWVELWWVGGWYWVESGVENGIG